MVRRGVAPTVGSMVAALAADGARAAVPESLAAVTARSATRLALGGVSQAGTASASAVSLMRQVLRASVVVKLKAAAAVLLFVAVAVAAIGAGAGARNPVRDKYVGRPPVVTTNAAAQLSADHRPADEIVKEIEAQLKAAARAQARTLG